MCVTWRIRTCDVTHSYVCHSVSDIIHMNEWYHTYEWVISHIRMSLITLMNELADRTTVIHIRDITHPWLWHDSSMIATWLIHTRDTPYSYVWHDAFTCVRTTEKLIHICDTTGLTYTWQMLAHWHVTYSFALEWFIYLTHQWIIHICDTTGLIYTWHMLAHWHTLWVCGLVSIV